MTIFFLFFFHIPRQAADTALCHDLLPRTLDCRSLVRRTHRGQKRISKSKPVIDDKRITHAPYENSKLGTRTSKPSALKNVPLREQRADTGAPHREEPRGCVRARERPPAARRHLSPAAAPAPRPGSGDAPPAGAPRRELPAAATTCRCLPRNPARPFRWRRGRFAKGKKADESLGMVLPVAAPARLVTVTSARL